MDLKGRAQISDSIKWLNHLLIVYFVWCLIAYTFLWWLIALDPIPTTIFLLMFFLWPESKIVDKQKKPKICSCQCLTSLLRLIVLPMVKCFLVISLLLWHSLTLVTRQISEADEVKAYRINSEACSRRNKSRNKGLNSMRGTLAKRIALAVSWVSHGHRSCGIVRVIGGCQSIYKCLSFINLPH